jgi:predicted nucleic acid-binding protein
MPVTTNRVFLDATYLVALASPRDQFHSVAVRLMEEILAKRVGMITTRAVLLEFANSLAAPKLRPKVIQTLKGFERDSLVEIVPLSEGLFTEGFVLFRDRPDKFWGLTDCISFVVMRERGISEALTADEHFEQAGFVALLNH